MQKQFHYQQDDDLFSRLFYKFLIKKYNTYCSQDKNMNFNQRQGTAKNIQSSIFGSNMQFWQEKQQQSSRSNILNSSEIMHQGVSESNIGKSQNKQKVEQNFDIRKEPQTDVKRQFSQLSKGLQQLAHATAKISSQCQLTLANKKLNAQKDSLNTQIIGLKAQIQGLKTIHQQNKNTFQKELASKNIQIEKINRQYLLRDSTYAKKQTDLNDAYLQLSDWLKNNSQQQMQSLKGENARMKKHMNQMNIDNQRYHQNNSALFRSHRQLLQQKQELQKKFQNYKIDAQDKLEQEKRNFLKKQEQRNSLANTFNDFNNSLERQYQQKFKQLREQFELKLKKTKKQYQDLNRQSFYNWQNQQRASEKQKQKDQNIIKAKENRIKQLQKQILQQQNEYKSSIERQKNHSLSLNTSLQSHSALLRNIQDIYNSNYRQHKSKLIITEIPKIINQLVTQKDQKINQLNQIFKDQQQKYTSLADQLKKLEGFFIKFSNQYLNKDLSSFESKLLPIISKQINKLNDYLKKERLDHVQNTSILQNSIKDANERIKGLEIDLAVAVKKQKIIEQKWNEVGVELNKSIIKIKTLQKTAQLNEENIKKLTIQIQKAKEFSDQTSSKLKVQSQLRRKSQQEITKKEAKIKELQTKLKDQQAVMAKILIKNDELTQFLNTQKTKLQLSQAQNEFFKKQLQKLEQSKEDLQKRYISQRKIIEEDFSSQMNTVCNIVGQLYKKPAPQPTSSDIIAFLKLHKSLQSENTTLTVSPILQGLHQLRTQIVENICAFLKLDKFKSTLLFKYDLISKNFQNYLPAPNNPFFFIVIFKSKKGQIFGVCSKGLYPESESIVFNAKKSYANQTAKQGGGKFDNGYLVFGNGEVKLRSNANCEVIVNSRIFGPRLYNFQKEELVGKVDKPEVQLEGYEIHRIDLA